MKHGSVLDQGTRNAGDLRLGLLGHRFVFANAPEASEGVGHASTHNNGSSQHVPNGHRNQILPENGGQGRWRARSQARRKHEHVRDGVLEANAHEHGDGKPEPHHLPRHAAGHRPQPHSCTQQPVAHGPVHNRLSERLRALGDDHLRSHATGPTCEQSGVERDASHREATTQVAQVGDTPVTQKALQGHASFQLPNSHDGRVSGKELSSGLRDQEHADWEQGRVQQLLEDRIGSFIASNHQS
mmetsp:Transcript_14859/g.27856  ORF Transcript_14859/g.27856 Transcript_14859/m.27856 type:complete len:242 (-) Transcript_14859:372-1097(-)